MTDLVDRAEAAFGRDPAPTTAAAPAVTIIPPGFDEKYRRLGERLRRVLETPGAGDYASASEQEMALIDALVKRRWSDDEVWAALRPSARYADRVNRKGRRHTDNLYAKELAKARANVTPFPADPVDPVFQFAAPVRIAPAITILPPAPIEQRPAPYEPVTSIGSFITEYVDYATKRTDAPAIAHELMAVTVLSALAGPNPRLPIATSVHGWRLSLWGMYVVNSTVGRKSTVLGFARDVISEVLGEAAIISWEGSPQGFIQKLAERNGQTTVLIRDEATGLIQSMNRGGHLSGLSQTMIRAYDGGTLDNLRVKKKNVTGQMESDSDKAPDPYFVQLSAATWDSITEAATIDNVLDGFLARYTIVTGAAHPQRMGTITSAMQSERDLLVVRAHEYHQRCRQIDQLVVKPAVLDASWDLEQAWLCEADSQSNPNAAAAVLKRLSESILKTAALIAIDEGNGPVIELEHFETAVRLGERWKPSTLAFIDALGATRFRRNRDRILNAVSAQPGISRAQLYRLYRNLRKRDFDEVIDALVEQDEIVRVAGESTGGRQPICLYPASMVTVGETEADDG